MLMPILHIGSSRESCGRGAYSERRVEGRRAVQARGRMRIFLHLWTSNHAARSTCSYLDLLFIVSHKIKISRSLNTLFRLCTHTHTHITLHHKVSPMSYLCNPATPVSITNIYKCLVSTFGYLYIRSVSWRIGHRQIST
jgi:hypothetical protein